jgi:DNA-binding PadR family transcriptional regulator
MHPYRKGGYGHWHGPRGSYYGRGNVKFAILDLLKEKPRHGYDIIREMEERSGGMYSPSPGVIYPTLQALEDQDFVSSAEQDGKKVYSITEEGLAYLQGQQEARRREGSHGGERRRAEEPNWIRTGPGGPGHGGRCGGEGPGHGPHGAAWGTWFASAGGPELMREMRWMFGDFASAIQRTLGDQQKMKEIREVLREAKAKIDGIVMR